MWNEINHNLPIRGTFQYTEVIMSSVIVPAVFAIIAVWGAAASIVVTVRDDYRQVPSRH
ncbi:hypothetical protein [Lacisediminihabitans sp.]|uniref:hypothetical protein n=1 Tax=Lacisediminihabitans sp. TaxID=2787631 RepID=UPI00374CEFB0